MCGQFDDPTQHDIPRPMELMEMEEEEEEILPPFLTPIGDAYPNLQTELEDRLTSLLGPPIEYPPIKPVSGVTLAEMEKKGLSMYELTFNGYAWSDPLTGKSSAANLSEQVEDEFNSLGECVNYCMKQWENIPFFFTSLRQIIVNIDRTEVNWLISFSDDDGREMIHTARLTI